MPYKRRSYFSRHFLSRKFRRFERKLDFFNSHRRFHQLRARFGGSSEFKCVSLGCASMSLERINLGKMNLQLVANEENQDRAQCGKNEASRMVPFVCQIG